jgi:hypothetical protein
MDSKSDEKSKEDENPISRNLSNTDKSEESPDKSSSQSK